MKHWSAPPLLERSFQTISPVGADDVEGADDMEGSMVGDGVGGAGVSTLVEEHSSTSPEKLS